MSFNIFDKISVNKDKLQPAKIILQSFGSNQIKLVGVIELQCTAKEITKKQMFVIVNEKVVPLLGTGMSRV